MTKDSMGNVIYSKEELASMGAIDLIEMIPCDCWEETDINRAELTYMTLYYDSDFEPTPYADLALEYDSKIYKIDEKYYELFKFISNFLTVFIPRRLKIKAVNMTEISTYALSPEIAFDSKTANGMNILTIPKTKNIFLELYKRKEKTELEFPKKGEVILINLCSIIHTLESEV